jgi:hypothetical protein
MALTASDIFWPSAHTPIMTSSEIGSRLAIEPHTYHGAVED